MPTDRFILVWSIAWLLLAILAGSWALLLFLKNPRARRAPPTQYTGSAFDASPLSPRIARVRQDYLTALHARPHPMFHPKALLDAARESIARLPYFCRSQEDHDPSGENTGPNVPHGT